MILKRWGVILFLLTALVISWLVFFEYGKEVFSPESLAPSPSLPEPQPFPSSSDASSVKPPEEIPDKFLLQVPFTPQAPTANWDEMHNEACE